MPTTVQVPATLADAVREMGGVAALLDKNGWKAAALIAAWVQPEDHGGNRRRSMSDVTLNRVSPHRFAKDLDAKGWSRNIILRHYDGWQAAAADGLVPRAEDLVPGKRIEVPTAGWAAYYPPPVEADTRYTDVGDKDAIAAQALADGTGVSKAVDIAKNPKAMAAAIKASPTVAKAAAQALMQTEGGVTSGLSDDDVTTAVKDAVVKRGTPAYRGFRSGNQQRRSEHPPAPLAPTGLPDDDQMDLLEAFSKMVGDLGDHIRKVGRFIHEHPGMTKHKADVLELEAETLHMIALAARGVADDELTALLQEGAS